MAEKQEEIKNSHTTIKSDDYRIEDIMTVVEEQVIRQKETNLSWFF